MAALRMPCAAGRETSGPISVPTLLPLEPGECNRRLVPGNTSVCAPPRRCCALQAEAAEHRQHAEWQAQRIEELQHSSSAAQLMRKYDLELQQLRAQFEQERRQLQAELAQARAGQATQVGARMVAARNATRVGTSHAARWAWCP